VFSKNTLRAISNECKEVMASIEKKLKEKFELKKTQTEQLFAMK
jgi:hypothetical protein